MTLSSSPLLAIPEKRYHTATKVLVPRLATIVGALALVPVVLALFGQEVNSVMIGAFALLMVIPFIVVFIVARYSWVAMNEHGIVYKGLGFKVATSWENVDSIGTRFMVNEGDVEGLVLIDNGLDVNGLVRASSHMSWHGTMALRGFENFIPLSNFQTKQWRDTQFGHDLRRYAPHLFEEN